MLRVFGTVYEDQNNRPHVYLCAGEDCWYFAQIFSKKRTDELEKRFSDLGGQWNPKIESLALFDYFIFKKTIEFEGQVASFQNSDKTDINGFNYVNVSIDKEDLKLMKEEILASNNVSGELQNNIRDINI